MKNKIWTLCIAALLVLSSSVTALAEDKQGEDGWEVVFDGEHMTSNFSNGKVDEQIAGLQPGDSVEITITLQNTYQGQADWYMKNQVGKALETASSAVGGAYDYLLTYTDIKGQTTTLYSSEKFGGDGKIGGVGLHGATNSLQNYFYLDRMGNGESGVVKLKVALDGETLVNDYQNTLARLQMDFATELVSGQTAGGDESTTPGDPSGLRTDRNAVKTGDETKIMRYVVLMFGSGLILLAGGIFLLRRQQEEET